MSRDYLINFSKEQALFLRDLQIEEITAVKTKVKNYFKDFNDEECTAISASIILAMGRTISQYLANEKGIGLEIYRGEEPLYE